MSGTRWRFDGRLDPAMTKIALFSALLVSACGGGWTVSDARHALELTATGIESVDQIGGAEYERVIGELDQSVVTEAEFDARVAPFNRLEEVIGILRALLPSGQTAVDAWEMGGELDWLKLSPCLVFRLGQLMDAIEQIDGIEMPSWLLSVVELALNKTEGSCETSVSQETS